MLAPWKKSYDQHRQHNKKQRHYTKVHIVKAMVFPVVIYGYESWTIKFSSVQWLGHVRLHRRPHGLQHARPPCPSPTPGVHSNSHPLSWWCHPGISSSVVSFSSCPQSLPASEFSNELTLHMRWPKYWSFSFSISQMATHSSTLARRIPQREEPGGLQSMRSRRVGHDWATSHIITLSTYWVGNRQEGQRAPNGGDSLQVSDTFISLKQQEETN